jgi:hypothetical protein
MQSASCQAFLGYHGPASPPASPLGFTYAIMADCGANGLAGPDGVALTDLQSIETATSHEITEAVTDPGPSSNDIGWAMTTNSVLDNAWEGLEVADMCIGIYAELDGNGNRVQRIWSNNLASASNAGTFGSPCSPAPSSGTTEVYGIPYQLVGEPGQSVTFPMGSFTTQTGTTQVNYSAVGGENYVMAFTGGSNPGTGSANVGSCFTLSLTIPAGLQSGQQPFSNCSVATDDANNAILGFWTVNVTAQQPSGM